MNSIMHRRYRLIEVLLVSLILATTLAFCVYKFEEIRSRNRLGAFSMSNSILLLWTLEELSTNGTVSAQCVSIIENTAYSSALTAISLDSTFLLPPFREHLIELNDYIHSHPREKETLILEELKKRLTKFTTNEYGYLTSPYDYKYVRGLRELEVTCNAKK